VRGLLRKRSSLHQGQFTTQCLNQPHPAHPRNVQWRAVLQTTPPEGSSFKQGPFPSSLAIKENTQGFLNFILSDMNVGVVLNQLTFCSLLLSCRQFFQQHPLMTNSAGKICVCCSSKPSKESLMKRLLNIFSNRRMDSAQS